MHWKLSTLPEDLRARLAEIGRSGGAGLGACHFRSDHRPGRLAALFALAFLATGGLVFALLGPSAPPLAAVLVLLLLTAIVGLWAAVLALELCRGLGSEIRPFLLLTPVSVVRCEYEHGSLEAHRLADATAYKAVDQYGDKQKYSGRQFQFTFPGALFSFTVKDREGIERVEDVLARARQKEGSEVGASLVPAEGGTRTLPRLRNLTNPFGAFWALMAALFVVAVIVLVVVARRSR